MTPNECDAAGIKWQFPASPEMLRHLAVGRQPISLSKRQAAAKPSPKPKAEREASKQSAEAEAHRAEVAKLKAEGESLKRTALATEERNQLLAENAAMRKQLRRREGFIGTILRGFSRSKSDKQPIASEPVNRPKRTGEGLASMIKVRGGEVVNDTPDDDAEKGKGFAGKIRFR